MSDTTSEVSVRAETIMQRSVCLTLRCTYLGNIRKVEVDDYDRTVASADAPRPEATVTDRTQVNVKKHLVDTRVLRAPNRVIAQAKNYLASRAIPTPRVFGERSYLIPTGLVTEVHAKLREFQGDLANEAQQVADAWIGHVLAQRAKLGPLFKAADYATPEDVRVAWTLRWSYVRFDAPEMLEAVDDVIAEEARRDATARFADAYDEVRLVLRETCRQLVADIARKLEPGDDLQPRQFRTTLLDDLADFLQTFPLRNIAGDGELDAMVARLRQLTAGLDPRTLRDDPTARVEAQRMMAAATAQLDELVENVGRSISFGLSAA